MKTKVVKKLIAVLCATTMSMSALTSAGAIEYSGITTMNQKQKSNFKKLNETIKKCLAMLEQMKQKITTYPETNDNEKNIKLTAISNINSITKNLENLNKRSVSSLDMLYKIEKSIQSLEASLNLLNSNKNLDNYNKTNDELSKANENIKNLLQEVTLSIKKEKATKNNKKINNNTDSNNQSITNNNMSYTDMMRYSLNICNTMKNNIASYHQQDMNIVN